MASICSDIHRFLSTHLSEQEAGISYLMHREVTTQLLLARQLPSLSQAHWMQFVQSARGGVHDLPGQIRQQIMT
ncbi:hypothetical protein WJX79_003717 [Trebouxia sp. C0005]